MSQEVGVGVFLVKDNKVLLGRRRSVIEDGKYAPPGGHVEFGESFEECAIRELKEETGLDITGLEYLTVTNHVFTEPRHVQLIAVFLRAKLKDPSQKPINVEPDKCYGWEWHDLDNLPKPLVESLETVLEHCFDKLKPACYK